jgi:hypothetical protein
MYCPTAQRMTNLAFNAIAHETEVRMHPNKRPVVAWAQMDTESARKALREHIATCSQCNQPEVKKPSSGEALEVPRCLKPPVTGAS